MNSQATVGSVIKTGEDGDPLGLVTVLNTQRYSGLQYMQQILEFLQHNAPTPTDASRLQQVSLLIVKTYQQCPHPPLLERTWSPGHNETHCAAHWHGDLRIAEIT